VNNFLAEWVQQLSTEKVEMVSTRAVGQSVTYLCVGAAICDPVSYLEQLLFNLFN
jgi:hypothetical protein